MRWPASILLVLATPAQGAPLPGPLVVLPFKQVNRGYELPRLQEGLAQTLIIDVAEAGVTSVVAWDAVASAVDFRALYDRRDPYTDAEAITLARGLGGKSVVVGSYETPGGDLRLAARLVSVEDGRELARAEVAGPDGRILELRAELEATLFGGSVRPLPRVPAPPKERGEPDPLRAFGAYSLALGDSDTTRVGLLRKALEDDPGFPYAVRELAALQARAAERAGWVRKPRAELESDLRVALAAPGLRGERRRDALRDFFQLLVDFGFQKQLVVLTDAVLAMTWPDADGGETRAVALRAQVDALRDRHLDHAARAAAERFTKDFSSHAYFHVMRRELEEIDRERADREKDKVRLAETLARLERRRIQIEADRCRELYGHYQYLRAARECEAHSRRYCDHADAQVRDTALNAWWTQAQALFELGDFAAARKVAEELKAKAPEFAEQRRLDLTLSYWPKE